MKLHCKWVLSAVMKIFQSPKVEMINEYLQAFLPLSMLGQCEQVIPSKLVANAMETLCSLAHSGPDFASSLSTVSDVFGDKTLVQYHKPLFRLPSMTQYKRYLQLCHEKNLDAQKNLDAEGRSKALTEMIEKVNTNMDLFKKIAESEVTFRAITVHLEDCRKQTATNSIGYRMQDSEYTSFVFNFNFNLVSVYIFEVVVTVAVVDDD